MAWKKIKLGEVLINREARFKPNDIAIVKLRRIDKINFSGQIFLSDKGSNTDMIIIKKGDLVISGINVEKGAIAVYEGEEDVAATIHYSSYEFNKDKIDIHFLKVFLRSPDFIQLLKQQVPGGIKTEIKPKHILPLEVYFPDTIEKQKEIAKLYFEKEKKFKDLREHLTYQLTQLENLNQAILQEAVQGKLVPQNPADEPASELLKRIKAEKEKSGKKEKPLPPIKPEEIPFEIPKSWVWCRLGEITEFITSGSRNWNQYYSTEGELFIRSQNIKRDKLDLSQKAYVSLPDKVEGKRTSVQKHDILITITGAGVSNSALVEKIDWIDAFVSQHVSLIRLIEKQCSKWIHLCIVSQSIGKAQFKQLIYGDKPGLNLVQLSHLLIPLTPLTEQNRIVAEIEQQLAKTKQLKEHILPNQQATEQLLKALLHEAFEVGEVKEVKTEEKEAKVIELKYTPTNVDYYKRTVLAAEIVWQLHKEPTLGHLKLQKLIYLCQKSAQMQLPTNFLRQAMGPYDPQMMRSIDKQLKEKKWFEYQQTESFKYHALEKAGQHHPDFLKYFSAEQVSIQYIIDTFKTVKSDFVEIVGTLYACLDTMKDEKLVFSDGLLLQRFYEWSEEKKKFDEAELKKVYKRMIELGLVPK